MKTDIRIIEGEACPPEGEGCRELFITVRPDPAAPMAEQIGAFEEIREVLHNHHAWICQERIYAPAGSIATMADARAAAYGEYDDGVSPSWLIGGPDEAIRGVQIYAISGIARPRPLMIDGHPCARLIQFNGCRWLTASALPTRSAPTPEAQTRLAFEQAESLLEQTGGDLTHIARTWFQLDRILDWYPSFNNIRSKFFLERGLLKPGSSDRLPASTGIGVSPANGNRVLMDLFAVVGDSMCPLFPGNCLCKHQATGHQKSAFNYGSSFARAATACTPAGRTVFVSGTAAIDAAGKTCHLGDVPAQIRMTIDCLNAALRDQQCSGADVVQAIAYCRTAKVESCFRENWAREIPWPWIIVRGDVCRDDLLFEAEVTACVRRPAHRPQHQRRFDA
jgi:enamine deaminase RidA (YjgF/YER057c/UK114 family)